MGAAGRRSHRPGGRGRRAILAGAALALAAACLSACEPGVYVVPDEFPADCSVDVSDALNLWMQAIPDGSTLKFNGGCFRIDHTLVLADRNNLEIDGQHALFKTDDPTGDGSPLSAPSREARTRAHWRLSGGSAITIHDLGIQGANEQAGVGDTAYVAALEAQHGIDINGTQAVELYNLVITKVYGDFVYFGLNGSTWSSGHVHDSVLSANGRQGISLTAAHDVTIENNYIGETRRSTFDLEPNGVGWGVDGAHILNNTIGPGRLLFVASAGDGPVSNVSVVGNQLHDRAMTLLVDASGTTRRDHIWIVDNTADQSWGTTAPAGVIAIRDVDIVVVTGNVQPMQAGRGDSGVDIRGSTAVTVTLNSFVDAGTLLYGTSPNAVLCGNQLEQNGPFDQPEPC